MVFQLCSTSIALTDLLGLSVVSVISKGMELWSVSQSPCLSAFAVTIVYQDGLDCMLDLLLLLCSIALRVRKHV